MDQANQPLSRRLRDAAIERTATEAERVDDYVIDRDGVIDLRELDRDELGASIADPAKALATIRGRLGDAHEVSGLYDESEPPRSRWRLGLRARHAFGGEIPTSATNSAVETIERPDVEEHEDTEEHADIETNETVDTSTALPPLSRLSLVPLAEETDGSDTGVVEATAGAGAETSDTDTDTDDTVIDLSDDDRPTATCPKCMGLGHRDLFDRFSQVEFYSCDSCLHMWQQDRS